MSYLPTLDEFLKAEEMGRVSAHRQGNLVGFKYNNDTIYSQDWDVVTLNARGIVFDSQTGSVVARPFKKFFNYNEFFDDKGNHTNLYEKLPPEWKPNLSGHFRCMEKADGSLGIVFYNPYTEKWQVKTGGSFDSAQAIWAQNWFDNNVDTLYLVNTRTYLFEIISKEDVHPIHYDFEGLVLLSVISNKTGEEYSLEEIKHTAELLKVRMVEIYNFDDFGKAVDWAKNLPKTQEGLVITFDNGFKCKAKSDDWCQLSKMFEGLNEWNIWVRYDCEKDIYHAHIDKFNAYKPIDDEILFIPEELGEIRQYAENLRKEIAEKTKQVMDIARNVQELTCERKKQHEYVSTNYPQLTPAIMKALGVLTNCGNDLTQVKKSIHKLLKPATEDPK